MTVVQETGLLKWWKLFPMITRLQKNFKNPHNSSLVCVGGKCGATRKFWMNNLCIYLICGHTYHKTISHCWKFHLNIFICVKVTNKIILFDLKLNTLHLWQRRWGVTWVSYVNMVPIHVVYYGSKFVPWIWEHTHTLNTKFSFYNIDHMIITLS